MDSSPETLDVIIVGGGLAGLVTAARLVELGRSPTVLEQGADISYPCNSRASGGIFHVSYTDMKASPEEILQGITTATRGEASPDLAQLMGANAARAIDWLAEKGVRFMKSSGVPWHRWTVAPPRPMKPGISFPGYGVDTVLRTLSAFVAQGGGEIRLGNRVRSATRAGDGNLVVEVETPTGVSCELECRALVLADGGFQANTELLARFITQRPASLLQRGARTGIGTGLSIGQSLGADIVKADRFYGHILHRQAQTDPNLWPYPQFDSVAAAAIVVDGNGTRFTDEGEGGIRITNAIARLHDPASSTVIFDESIWMTAGRESLSPVNPDVETLGGRILRARSIADLACQLGVGVGTLQATIEQYNAAVAAGAAHELDPPRSGAASVLDTDRLMAAPLCAGITHTMGGLRVNGRLQVLRPEGDAIPGLFAAGTTTGGLEGGKSVGYVGGLSQACIMGMAAAETIAGVRPGISAAASPGQVEAPAAIPRYRALKLAVRFGKSLSLLFGLMVGLVLGIGLGGAPLPGAVVVGLAAAGALVAYGLARVMLDLFILITDVLLPQDTSGR